MKHLPHDKYLPIQKLAACFNNTSATYKFYWLLSIIDALEARVQMSSTIIPKKELFARMLSNAWYPVNYFHVSFGKQDKLQSAIENIKVFEGLTIDAKKEDIIRTLLETNNLSTTNQLSQFNNNVPHWFLSPWFPKEDRNSIYKNSQRKEYYSPYSLKYDLITVDLHWANYLLQNAAFVRDFCYWNLVVSIPKNQTV